MRHVLLFLFLCASCVPSATAQTKPSGPVVVELFSSEGCSSCPPADEVLRTLDSEGKAIALELHVDYWNDLGWVDPFSKPEWSARQRMYGKSYTPQAVIDGSEELIGSRESDLRDAIDRAARKPHLAVTIAKDKDAIVVKVPASSLGERATVFLAATEPGLSTVVPRGENAGRTLKHGPIVRELRNLGPISGNPVELKTPLPREAARRFVGFVQGDKSHRIFGSAVL
jgi:hypothetical protein